jgi:hypothetical protein
MRSTPESVTDGWLPKTLHIVKPPEIGDVEVTDTDDREMQFSIVVYDILSEPILCVRSALPWFCESPRPSHLEKLTNLISSSCDWSTEIPPSAFSKYNCGGVQATTDEKWIAMSGMGAWLPSTDMNWPL